MSEVYKRICTGLMLTCILVITYQYKVTYMLLPIASILLTLETLKLYKQNNLSLWLVIGLIFYAFLPNLWIAGYQASQVHLMRFIIIGVIIDTAGYVFGRLIGGAKLAPTISPKKTIAGFIAGFACLHIAAAIYGGFFWNNVMHVNSSVALIKGATYTWEYQLRKILAIIIYSVCIYYRRFILPILLHVLYISYSLYADPNASQYLNNPALFKYMSVVKHLNLILRSYLIVLIATGGDLLISKIKRLYKLKDTGSILPGHGGLWDRLDSHVAILGFTPPVMLILHVCFEALRTWLI